jgi:O-Antigen ligase
MRLLLIALIAFMTLSSTFAWDPGPMPGMTIKNALLYMMMVALVLRASMDRSFRLQLAAIPVTFSVLIAYAIFSYLAVVLVIQYPNYNIIKQGMNLKGMVDQLAFFLVFFYGLRNDKDALFILKILLFAWALSHVVAVLDAIGIVHIGDVEQREDGRVQGVVGEANQYGAFVAMSLPGMIGAAITTRGKWRLMWIIATAVTAVTLLMTVSRGAFVAVFVAGAWGVFVFRRYVPTAKLAMWAAAAFVSLVIAVIMAGALGFGDLLYQRVMGTGQIDLVLASSGRTEFWTNAFVTMFRHPVTLLTGYGWGSWWSFPFRWSPHNYYVNTWFNLGLPGLICAVILLWLPIRYVMSSIAWVEPLKRPVMITFVMATVAFAVATFFVDLYSPWLDYWAYAGIVLRVAMNAREGQYVPVAVAPSAPAPRHDAFGWVGAARR